MSVGVCMCVCVCVGGGGGGGGCPATTLAAYCSCGGVEPGESAYLQIVTHFD